MKTLGKKIIFAIILLTGLLTVFSGKVFADEIDEYITFTYHEQINGEELKDLNVTGMPPVQEFKKGVSFTHIIVPSSPNYTFNYWMYVKDGQPNRLKVGDQFFDNTDFYAVWTPTLRGIYYELNDGINHPENPNYFYGSEPITLKEPTKVGHNFLGWYDNAGFSNDPITSLGSGDKSITLYARWQIKVYDIVFLDENDDVIDSVKVNHGDKFSFPLAPTKLGYVFDGWFDEKNNQYDENSVAISNLTLKPTYKLDDVSGTFFVFEQDGVSYIIDEDEITFTGLIPWYDEDLGIGRVKGNRVGIKITAPENVILDNVEVLYNGTTYTWNQVKDGPNYFEWWPLFTNANTSQSLTVTWNQECVQEFIINLDEDARFVSYVSNETELIAALNNNDVLEIYLSDDISLTDSYELVRKSLYLFTTSEYTLNLNDFSIKFNDTEEIENYFVEGNFLTGKFILDNVNGHFELEGYPGTTTIVEVLNTYVETAIIRGYWGVVDVKTITSLTIIEDAAVIENIITVAKSEIVIKDDATVNNSEYSGTVYYGSYDHYFITVLKEDGSTFDTIKVPSGNNVNPPIPPKYGHLFDCWVIKDSSDNIINRNFENIREDLTLIPKYVKGVFSINFLTNSETVIEPIVQEFDSEINVSIVDIEIPQKSGYTFLGWDKEIPELMPGENIIIEALWKITDYDIVYELDGGTNDENNPETFTLNDLPLTLNNPTKYGYVFKGWYLDSNFNNKFIEHNELESIVVYAKWEVLEFSVTYYLNDGIYHNDNPSMFTVEYLPLTLKEPTKEEFVFLGWYLDSEFEIAFTEHNLLENLTVYAQWEPLTTKEELIEELKILIEEYDEIIGDVATITVSDKGDVAVGFAESDTIVDDVQIAAEAVIDALKSFAGANSTLTVGGKTLLLADVASIDIAIAILGSWAGLDEFLISGELSAPYVAHVEFGNNEDIKLDGELMFKLNFNPRVVKLVDEFGNEIDEFEVPHGTILPEPIAPFLPGYEFYWWADEDWTQFDFSKPIIENVTIEAWYDIATYNIIYNLNGGIIDPGANPEEYTIYDLEIDLENPTRDEYIFKGWLLNDKLITKLSEGTYGNLVLTAQWEAIEYDITYVLNSGENHLNNPNKYTIEDEITLLEPTKIGYTFDGWLLDGVIVTIIDEGTIGNLTLVASWTANKYTVTFNSNGGDVATPEMKEVTYDLTYGELAIVSRIGYTFIGWYTEVTGGLEVKSTDAVEVTSNQILYAKWEVNQYIITFNSNGGSLVESITQDYNSNITAPADPIRVGYLFDGWDVSVPTRMPAENLTLTAQWEAIEYDITYVLNGGENHLNNPNKYTIEDEIILLGPTKIGYTFNGWLLDSVIVTIIEEGTIGNLTLVASWKVNRYTVTFNSNGGDVANPTSKEVTYNSTYGELATVNRIGYTFSGWYTEVTGGLEVKSTDAVEITSNQILYAQWEVNQYTLTWIVDGDETEVKYDYNSPVTRVADPEKDGYKFIGWSLDIPSFMPAEDITLTALWEQLLKINSVTTNAIDGEITGGLTFEVEAVGTHLGRLIVEVQKSGVKIVSLTLYANTDNPIGNINEECAELYQLLSNVSYSEGKWIFTFDTNGLTNYSLDGLYSFIFKAAETESGQDKSDEVVVDIEVYNSLPEVISLESNSINGEVIGPVEFTIKASGSRLASIRASIYLPGGLGSAYYINSIELIADEDNPYDDLDMDVWGDIVYAEYNAETMTWFIRLNPVAMGLVDGQYRFRVIARDEVDNPINQSDVKEEYIVVYNDLPEVISLESNAINGEVIGPVEFMVKASGSRLASIRASIYLPGGLGSAYYINSIELIADEDNPYDDLDMDVWGDIVYAEYNAETMTWFIRLNPVAMGLVDGEYRFRVIARDEIDNPINQSDVKEEYIVVYNDLPEIKSIESNAVNGEVIGPVEFTIKASGSRLASIRASIYLPGGLGSQHYIESIELIADEDNPYDDLDMSVWGDIVYAEYNAETMTWFIRLNPVAMGLVDGTYRFRVIARDEVDNPINQSDVKEEYIVVYNDLPEIEEFTLDNALNGNATGDAIFTISASGSRLSSIRASIYEVTGGYVQSIELYADELDPIGEMNEGMEHLYSLINATYNASTKTWTVTFDTVGMNLEDKEYRFQVIAKDGILTNQSLPTSLFVIIKNKFTITYLVDEDVYGEVETYTFTKPITLKEEPTKAGYIFSGWDIVSFPETMPANNLIISGTFTTIDYTITYVLNYGINDESNPIIYTIENEITLLDATKEGYYFKGWYLDSSFNNQISVIEEGTIGNKTLYAKWERIITKEEFVEEFEELLEEISVANVQFIDEDFFVEFKGGLNVNVVKDAAEELVIALLALAAPDSKLIIGEDEFTLGDVDITALAKAILGSVTIEDFLSGAIVEVSYVAIVNYLNNPNIVLEGAVEFKVVGTEEEFIEELETLLEDIQIADVRLVDEDFFVEFNGGLSVNAVKDAATELVTAFLALAAPDSKLIVGGQEFTLGTVDVGKLAKAILGSVTIEEFLSGAIVEVSYVALVNYLNNPDVVLEGTVEFKVVGSTDEFIEELEKLVKDIQVADVRLTDEDFMVKFPTGSNVNAIKDAAEELVVVLLQLATADSKLIVAGQEFTLGTVDVAKLAKTILGEVTLAEFFEGEVVVVSYRAEVNYLNNPDVILEGLAEFKIIGTEEEFLLKLDRVIEDIQEYDVIFDLEEQSFYVQFEENVNVNSVKDFAEELVNTFLKIAAEDSKLIIKGEEFTLGDVNITALAKAILGNVTIEEFLAGAIVEVSYIAEVNYLNNPDIVLDGVLEFKVVGTEEEFIEKLESLIEDIQIADVSLVDEDFSIVFEEGLSVNAVKDFATELVDAFLAIAAPDSKLIIGNQEFILESVNITALAKAMLGEVSLEEFLDGAIVIVDYIAEVNYLNNPNIVLEGSAKFEIVFEDRIVKFDLNGGSPVIPQQKIAYKDKAVKPTTEPTKLGYVFVGWYYDGILYEFNTLVREDITLTAEYVYAQLSGTISAPTVDGLTTSVEGNEIIFSGLTPWNETEDINTISIIIYPHANTNPDHVLVTIGLYEYTWEEFNNGNWLFNITEPNEAFTIDIMWNEISFQTFTVKISNNMKFSVHVKTEEQLTSALTKDYIVNIIFDNDITLTNNISIIRKGFYLDTNLHSLNLSSKTITFAETEENEEYELKGKFLNGTIIINNSNGHYVLEGLETTNSTIEVLASSNNTVIIKGLWNILKVNDNKGKSVVEADLTEILIEGSSSVQIKEEAKVIELNIVGSSNVEVIEQATITNLNVEGESFVEIAEEATVNTLKLSNEAIVLIKDDIVVPLIQNNSNGLYYDTLDKYRVTFIHDGETTFVDINRGNKATSIPSTKTGYTLVGWYLGDVPFDFNTPIKAEYTLTAIYEIDDFNLSISGYDNPVTYPSDVNLVANTDSPLSDYITYKWYKDEALVAETLGYAVVGVLNSGTYKVVATLTHEDNVVTNEETINVVINKGTTVITASDIDVTYDGFNKSISATIDNSEQIITYSENNKQVNVGTYTVTINIAATNNYNGSSTTRTITITPKEVTLTIGNKTSTYGNEIVELTATANDLVDGETLSYTLSTTAISTSNVGTYLITASFIEGSNPNYTVTTVTDGTYIITQAILTVTPSSNQNKVYGNDNPTYTYEISGLANNDELADVLEGLLARAAGESVGKYAIQQGSLKLKGETPNYTLEFIDTVEFEIKEATLTVTPTSNQSKVYGEVNPTYTYEISGLANNDELADVLEGLLARTTGESVGKYLITLGSLKLKGETPNYTLEFEDTVEFEITKATLTVTPTSNQSKVYGEVNPTYTYEISGLANNDELADVLEGLLARAAGESVGKYAIQQGSLKLKGETPNYTLEFEDTVEFEIKKATLTVTPTSNQKKVYGNDNPTYTYEISGLANNDEAADVIEGLLARAAGESVGKYLITLGSLKLKGETPNYTLVFIDTVEFEIEKATFNVVFNNATYTYDGNEKTLLISGTLPSEITVSYKNNKLTTAGSILATAMFTVSSNYNEISDLTATLTIDKADSVITANSIESTYDGTYKTLDNASLNHSEKPLVYSTNSYKDAGTYTVTITVEESTNYNASSITKTIKINKKTVTLTIDNKTSTYGENIVDLTAAVSGLIGTDTLIYTLTKEEGTNAGTYDISATYTPLSNYDVTVNKGTYTINKANSVITANNVESTYDGDNKSISATLNHSEKLLSYSNNSHKDVGIYTVTITVEESTNYNALSITRTIKINTKAVTLTINNQTSPYGVNIKDLTATINGLVSGDALSYELFTDATPSSNVVGNYTIEANLGSNPNYNITVNNGTYTIEKGTPNILPDTVEIDYTDNALKTFEVANLNGELTTNVGVLEDVNGVTYDFSNIDLSKGASTFIVSVTVSGDNIVETSKNITFKFKSVSIKDGNNETQYYTIEDALNTATSGTIIVKYHTSFSQKEVAQLVYQKTSYTILNDVTLLVPYSNAFKTTLDDTPSSTGGALSRGNAYARLIMPAEIELNVFGTVTVNAMHANNSTRFSGHVTGTNYAELSMGLGSKINVKSGGKLNSSGFIYGNGEISAESGSTVTEFLFIKSFRGGTATTRVQGDVFPIDQFTVNSIETKTTYKTGSKLNAKVLTYMSSSYQKGEINLIGTGAGPIFDLQQGFLVKSYNKTTGDVTFDLHGNASLNNTSVSISSINLSSNGKDMPFDGTWHIKISSGSDLQINSYVALLPGATVTIEEGASATITSNGRVTVFDPYKYITDGHIKNYPEKSQSYYREVPVFSFNNDTPAVMTVNGSLLIEADGAIAGRVRTGENGHIMLDNKADTKYSYKYVEDNARVASREVEFKDVDHGIPFRMFFNSGPGSFDYNFIYASDSTGKFELADLTIPTINDKDFRFDGWYTGQDYLVKVEEPVPATDDIMVYAKWVADVKFVKNDGTDEETILHQTYGKDYVYPDWYDETVFWFTASTDGEPYVFVNPVEKIDHSTVYARWNLIPKNVTFQSNGGTNIDSLSVVEGTVINLDDYTPTKEDAVFQGWYTTGWNTVEEFNLESRVFSTLTVEKDIIFYARWADEKSNIKIELESDKYEQKGSGDITLTVTVTDDYGPVEGVLVYFDALNKNWKTEVETGQHNSGKYGKATAKYSATNANDTVKINATEQVTESSDSVEIKVTYEEPCVADGTLITLADGSQKPVEELTGDELLLVWNLNTGSFDIAPIAVNFAESFNDYEIIHLHFSDGTDVKIIDEHAFWDFDLNRYAFINKDNAQEHLGHWFKKQITDADGNLTWTKVELIDVDIEHEYTRAWTPITYEHLSFYANGMLSMTGEIGGIVNTFEVSPETMKIDEDAYLADIAEYGLFTYEEFAQVINVPEEMFDAFQAKHLKVSIGKGHITLEDALALIMQYGEWVGLE